MAYVTYIEGNVSSRVWVVCAWCSRMPLLCHHHLCERWRWTVTLTFYSGGLTLVDTNMNLQNWRFTPNILFKATLYLPWNSHTFSPLRIGRNPKGKDRLPTTVFSGVMLVLQRVLFFLTPSTKSWKFLLPFCLQKKRTGKSSGSWRPGGGLWFDFRSTCWTKTSMAFMGGIEVIMKVLFGPGNLNKKLPQRNTWKLQNKGKWKNPPFLKRHHSPRVMCYAISLP